MFRLEIFKPDGSKYWQDHFETLEIGKKWLDEEKTRPYWNPMFTYEFTDMTPKEDPIEKNKKKDRELRREARNKLLKEFCEKADGDIKLGDVKSILKELIGHLGLFEESF